MEVAQGNESVAATEIAGSEGGETSGSVEGAEGSDILGGAETPATETEPGLDTDTVDAKAGAEAYTPNLKYNVLDEEFEFDEDLKAAISNEKIEAKVRELYEKAHGIEHIKNDRQTLKTEFSQLKEKSEETQQALQTLGQYVAKDDFDSFFHALNIPTDKVLKYALDIAQRTPEQSQAIMQQRQASTAAMDFERKQTELERSQQEFAVKQKTFELDQHLSTPDNAGFIQMFDSKVGRPGAFREEVIKRGQMYAAQGNDISVEQAVQEVTSLLRPVYGEAQTHAAPQSPQVVAPNSKPTLPNVRSSGTSAIKRTPNTLADLHKLRDMAQQGAL